MLRIIMRVSDQPYHLFRKNPYMRTVWWNKGGLDTDKAMQSFFDGCYEAGPDGCPFYAPSSEEISKNLTQLYDRISRTPVPVHSDEIYGLVDYDQLRLAVFTSLYAPFARFHPLAQALSDLAKGNGTALYRMNPKPGFDCSCDDTANPFEEMLLEGGYFVGCTDGQAVPPELEYAIKYYEEMANQSAWGTILADDRILCSYVGLQNYFLPI